jgi:hypothetical protein
LFDAAPMDFWGNFTRHGRLRMAAILIVVILVFTVPWRATGSASYPAYEPALISISPANSTAVTFDPGGRAIDLAVPASGAVRADLVRTPASFDLTGQFEVTDQNDTLDSVWHNVSTTVPVPAGGTSFTVLFGTANSSVDLAAVTVANADDPSEVLYSANFSASTNGWSLLGTGSFGAFGTPSLRAIEVTNNATATGYAASVDPASLGSPVTSVTVRALVLDNGVPGPFKIALDIFGPTDLPLGYIADWQAWASYAVAPSPLTLLLWTVELTEYTVELSFLATGPGGGELAIETLVAGTVESTSPIGPYQIGEAVAVSLARTAGESLVLQVTPPGGTVYTWSSAAYPSGSGVQQLAHYSYFTASLVAQGAGGSSSRAVVVDATYTFSGSDTFAALSSSPWPGLFALLAAFLVLGLLAPEWWPAAVRGARFLRSGAGGRAIDHTRSFLVRHRVALAVAVGSLALYAYVALTFGGHPYDSWSYKIWNATLQSGGIQGLYVHTQFVGDAPIRGDTPWSATIFSYGPVSAYLIEVTARILPSLNGYPNAAAFNAAAWVSSEIKWIFALFTVAAGAVLYAVIRRVTGRTDLAILGFLLIVLNPAIGFDSVVWGETDSVMYFLFVLFAAVAVRAPTLALGVTAVALAFKETGPILLFPSLLLVLGPGISGLERLRRLAVGATVLLVVTVPVVLAGLLPSVLLSSYAGLFSSFVTGSSTAQPFVSPETYTVWTLFTGFVGGRGLTRFMIDSSTPLVAGLSFALLGTAVFAISWLVMLAFVRKGARSPSLAFWFATTSFGAVTFTALLTGTGSRYYTLALPGLAALVVLVWDRGPWLRSIILAAYAIVTALAFWTMYGVLTVIMSREYPNILGLGLSYNPLSRFVLQWYQDNNVITLGSIGAVAAVLLISYALWMLARPEVRTQRTTEGPVPAERGSRRTDATGAPSMD